jgi:hypothetical protein
MMRRKLGTIARPAGRSWRTTKGFGRKVYDPNADTPAKYVGNLAQDRRALRGVANPEGQISAFADLVKGEGDPRSTRCRPSGPIAGVTFSKGAPGGPAVGELYKAREHARLRRAGAAAGYPPPDPARRPDGRSSSA